MIDRQRLRNIIGSCDVEDVPDLTDNIAIALCTYFSAHMDRPDPDPESESGWGEWVTTKTNAALSLLASAVLKEVERTTNQPSAATENPEAMYSPVAREGHAGASARQIDVAAGDQLAASQPERCCLDYPRCDCNSPPEPDNLPCGHPASLLLMSAETGEALYCELCDDKSGRRDAEQCETELRAEVERLKTALKTVGDDYPGSSCQQWCYEAAGIRAPAEWPTREEAEKRAAELMTIGRSTLGENDDWLCFQRPTQPKVTP